MAAQGARRNAKRPAPSPIPTPAAPLERTPPSNGWTRKCDGRLRLQSLYAARCMTSPLTGSTSATGSETGAYRVPATNPQKTSHAISSTLESPHYHSLVAIPARPRGLHGCGVDTGVSMPCGLLSPQNPPQDRHKSAKGLR